MSSQYSYCAFQASKLTGFYQAGTRLVPGLYWPPTGFSLKTVLWDNDWSLFTGTNNWQSNDILFDRSSSRSIFASWHKSILFKMDHCPLALINLFQDGSLPLDIDRSSARSIIDSHYPFKLHCSMLANWSCSELIRFSAQIIIFLNENTKF